MFIIVGIGAALILSQIIMELLEAVFASLECVFWVWPRNWVVRPLGDWLGARRKEKERKEYIKAEDTAVRADFDTNVGTPGYTAVRNGEDSEMGRKNGEARSHHFTEKETGGIIQYLKTLGRR